MRCASCLEISWNIFCKECQKNLLIPQITKRSVGTLEVYSFYHYWDLERFLLTKHTPLGFRVFKALAKISMRPFMASFIQNDPRDVWVVGVDENIRDGYSHVAVMTHQMRFLGVNVSHGALKSKNAVKYSGKSLQYRLENRREFVYSGPKGVDVILVDDIITSGLTLQEAYTSVSQADNRVLFALTLADARQ